MDEDEFGGEVMGGSARACRVHERRHVVEGGRFRQATVTVQFDNL